MNLMSCVESEDTVATVNVELETVLLTYICA